METVIGSLEFNYFGGGRSVFSEHNSLFLSSSTHNTTIITQENYAHRTPRSDKFWNLTLLFTNVERFDVLVVIIARFENATHNIFKCRSLFSHPHHPRTPSQRRRTLPQEEDHHHQHAKNTHRNTEHQEQQQQRGSNGRRIKLPSHQRRATNENQDGGSVANANDGVLGRVCVGSEHEPRHEQCRRPDIRRPRIGNQQPSARCNEPAILQKTTAQRQANR